MTNSIQQDTATPAKKQAKAKKLTWASMMLTCINEHFGDREFKRAELFEHIELLAGKHWPDNANWRSTAAQVLGKMKKAGLIISTRRGYYQAV